MNKSIPYVFKSSEEKYLKTKIKKLKKKFNSEYPPKIAQPSTRENITSALLTRIPSQPLSATANPRSSEFSDDLILTSCSPFPKDKDGFSKTPIEVNPVRAETELTDSSSDGISMEHRRPTSCLADISDYSNGDVANNSEYLCNARLTLSDKYFPNVVRKKFCNAINYEDAEFIKSSEMLLSTKHDTHYRIPRSHSRFRLIHNKLGMSWCVSPFSPSSPACLSSPQNENKGTAKLNTKCEGGISNYFIVEKIGANLRLIADQFEKNKKVNIVSLINYSYLL